MNPPSSAPTHEPQVVFNPTAAGRPCWSFTCTCGTTGFRRRTEREARADGSMHRVWGGKR